MLRHNSFLIGFAVGVTVPVLAYLAVETGLEFLASAGVTGPNGQAVYFKERTLALLAVCANLLPFYKFNSRFTEATMRGVLVATGVLVAGWFWVYGRALLNGDIS